MATIADDSAERQHVLIIHELGRRWVDALRGLAVGSRIQIRHSASVADTLRIARAAQRGTLVIELGRNPLESLELMERVHAVGSELVIIVVASSNQSQLEVAARELGATAFVQEPITGTELAQKVRSIVRLQVTHAGRICRD